MLQNPAVLVAIASTPTHTSTPYMHIKNSSTSERISGMPNSAPTALTAIIYTVYVFKHAALGTTTTLSWDKVKNKTDGVTHQWWCMHSCRDPWAACQTWTWAPIAQNGYQTPQL